MDYKELLAKYMKHVADYEGTTFVNVLNSPHCDVEFTDEEVEALEEIQEGLE